MKRIVIIIFVITSILFDVVGENIQLFEAGKKAFSVGLYSIALENLDLYLSDNNLEKKSDALYLSGISSYYLKKYDQSISYLQALTIEFPNSNYASPSYYWLGLNNYYLKKYEEAVNQFNQNIDCSNSSFKDISILYKALSNIQLGRNEDAKENLKSIIDNPDSNDRYVEEALYRLSSLYMEEMKLNDAINYLNKLIFDYPKSKYYINSLSLLSDAYYLLKEWNSAARSYELLKEFTPDNSNIYKRLSNIYYNLGDYNKTKATLYFYDTNFGSDKEILFMLGDLLVKEGNLLEAISIYKKIDQTLELSLEDQKDNQVRLGKIYYEMESYSNAYEQLKDVNDKDSIYLAILSGLNSDKSVISLIKRINSDYFGDKYSLDSNNRYINRLESRGNKKELSDFLNYLTTLYPKNIDYSLTFGEMLLEENKLDESLKYLTIDYNKNSPYYENISYKLGWIYYNKDEYSRSIEYFNRVTNKSDDYIKAIYSKSIAYYKIGQLAKGKEGFISLLNKNTPYNSQISFYLGLIEKDSYNYKDALKYFTISKSDKNLEKDSINNIAWCYYHLEDYQNALDIYLENGNIFNAANSYLFLKEYEKALELYLEVIQLDNELKSSAYYKSIEILFDLDRDTEAFDLVSEYMRSFPNISLPGEVISTHGDNLLYSGNIDDAIITFREIMEIFPKKDVWFKARYRLAEAYTFKEDYEKSITFYFESIKDEDPYSLDSVDKIVNIISNVGNPTLTNSVKELFDNNISNTEKVIPIYIEYIRQSIQKNNILDEIETLINLSRSRNEIDQLIYLKSLHYYTTLNLEESETSLKVLLEKPEVNEVVKIDSLMLKGKILSETNLKREAIDLYLNLYINFSSNIEAASKALYSGLILAKELGDEEMENKILQILKNEYSETTWAIRGLNEN